MIHTFLVFLAVFLLGVSRIVAAPVLETRATHSLGFEASDAVLDAAGNALWFADPVGKRLVRVQLDAAWTTDSFSVDPMPERLSVSRDGRWLYATLVRRLHTGNDPASPESGATIEVDLRDPANRTVVELPVDPYAIASGANSRILVSGLRDSQYSVQRVDFTDRSVSTGMVVPFFYSLALHPSENRAYGAGWGANAFQRLDLMAGSLIPVRTTIVGDGSSTVFSQFDMHPDGTRLAVNPNRILVVPDDPLREPFSISSQAVFTGRPVFDPPRRSLFAAGPVIAANGTQVPGLLRFNSASGVRVESYEVPQAEWFFPMDKRIASVAWTSLGSVIRLHDNPAAGSESNKPPQAILTIAPQPPRLDIPIRLDAGNSTDDEAGLVYSWALSRDGAWSAESLATTAEFTVSTHGTQIVGLRVRDRQGEVDELRRLIHVAASPEVIAANPFDFALPVGSLAAIAYHPTQPRAYIADGINPRIIEVDLEKGFVEREFFTPQVNSKLAVTPDGGWLEVASMTERDPSKPFLKSSVSEINLLDGTPGNTTLVIPGAPLDLLVLDRRRVVLSTSASITTFDMTTGTNSGSFGMNSAPRIRLADGGNHLLVTGNDGQLHRLPLDPVTGVALPGDSWMLPGQEDNRPVFPLTTRSCMTSLGVMIELPESGTKPLTELGRIVEGLIYDVWREPGSRGTFFVASRDGLQQFNSQSYRKVRTLSSSGAHALVVHGSNLFALDANYGVMRRYKNPALEAEGNQPPTARLAAIPASPDTMRPIIFDASVSTDDRDTAGQLLFRWRIDGPITFESAQQTQPRFTNWCYVAGRYVVTAEVQDSYGMTNSVSRAFEVVDTPDPGISMANVVGDLGEILVFDAKFDSVRPYLYFTELNKGTLYRWNVETGIIDRRWEFGGSILSTSLALSPDGRSLYAAVNRLDTGSTVARFDLESQARIKEFKALLSIDQIVAMDAGRVVVAGRGMDDHQISVFDSGTAVQLGVFHNFDVQSLTLHPSQRAVYTCESIDGPIRAIVRYELDPDTGGLRRSPSWVNRPNSVRADQGVFALNDPDLVMTGQGQLLRSSPDSALDLTYVGSFGSGFVTAFAFGPRPGDLILGSKMTGEFMFFHGTPYKPLLQRSIPFDAGLDARAISVHGDTVLTALGYPNGRLRISRMQFPVRSAAENRPPTVVISKPTTNAAFSSSNPSIYLTAESSDPDGMITNLSFQINGQVVPTESSGKWNHPGPGIYTVTAVAEDNWGARATSAPVTFQVAEPPRVEVTKPSVDHVFDAPVAIDFEAEATDPDGSIRQVEYYNGTNLLGIATSAPYHVTSGLLIQNLGFRVVAVDNLGLRTEQSFPVNFRGPLGDEYLRPFELQGFRGVGRASNRDATRQAGEIPKELGSTAGRSVWWRWVAPTNGVVVASTKGSTFDTLLGVYIVTNGSGRNLVASNDNDPQATPFSSVKFIATNGGDYRFILDVPSGRAGGDAVLTVEMEPLLKPLSGSPTNDAFAARKILSGANVSSTVDSSKATLQGSEPPIIYGIPGGASLWWEWTPPTAGIATISTAGSAFDTLLGVYRGSAFLSNFGVDANRVISNDDDPRGGRQSLVRFYIGASERLFITVDGYAGGSGTVQLQVDLESQLPSTSPPNDRFVDRIPIQNAGEVVFSSNMGAQYDGLEPFAINRPLWWTWTATETRSVVVSTVGSTMATILGVYMGNSLDSLSQVALARPVPQGTPGPRQVSASFIAVAGQSYQIAVAADSVKTPGSIQLQIIPAWPLPSVPLFIYRSEPFGLVRLSLGTNDGHTAIILSSTNFTSWRTFRSLRPNDEPGQFLDPLRFDQEFLRAVLWD